MTNLNLGENIARLRRQKGLTQDELAAFLGVTKASVSKWETRQSLPDILMLPVIASFFDISTDELLGYRPQLSREQIKKLYQELAERFASGGFAEAMAASRSLVKKYYSCYPFLLQICVLWLDHADQAPPAERPQLLEEIIALCRHIENDCRNAGVCSDASSFRAMVQLQLGCTQEVIETLEESCDPFRLSRSNDLLLIRAYLGQGNPDAANRFAQISMYLSLLSILENAALQLVIRRTDQSACEELLCRTDSVIEAFDFERLHPNLSAGYFYQAAIFCAGLGQNDRALDYLERFASCVRRLFDSPVLHGDRFFDCLDSWIDELGAATPRSMKLVAKSIPPLFEHPAFAALQSEERLRKLKAMFLDETLSHHAEPAGI